MKYLVPALLFSIGVFFLGAKYGVKKEMDRRNEVMILFSSHNIDSTTFEDSLYVVSVSRINEDKRPKVLEGVDYEYFWRHFIYDYNSKSDEPVGVINIYKIHPYWKVPVYKLDTLHFRWDTLHSRAYISIDSVLPFKKEIIKEEYGTLFFPNNLPSGYMRFIDSVVSTDSGRVAYCHIEPIKPNLK